MGARAVVVAHVREQHVAQMAFAEYHDMIKAIPAERFDQPFGVWHFATVSEETSGGLEYRWTNPTQEYFAVCAIAVPDQVTRDLLSATRLRKLVGDPYGRRMRGDPKLQDLPPAMAHDQHWPISMPSLRSAPWILGVVPVVN